MFSASIECFPIDSEIKQNDASKNNDLFFNK